MQRGGCDFKILHPWLLYYKLSALLTGRTMDVYTRMSDTDANDYDKLKKALLTRYSYTEDGYRKSFREDKPETEEPPDQFVVRLKNYLAKWLELSGNSSGDFEARVDLIVKEQFINACSEELAVYLLERGPKDLIELTSWAQQNEWIVCAIIRPFGD